MGLLAGLGKMALDKLKETEEGQKVIGNIEKYVDNKANEVAKYITGADVKEETERALAELDESIFAMDPEGKNPQELCHLGDDASSRYYTSKYYNTEDKKERFLQAALFWYEKAGEAGDNDGAYKAGAMYHRGDGCEENLEKALYWYEKAAEAIFYEGEYPYGALEAGDMYYKGEGCEKNLEKALYYYEKAGKFEKCENIKRECEAKKRESELEKAALGGDAQAMYDLFRAHGPFGKPTVSEVNPEEALCWLKKAAQAGHKDAIAVAANYAKAEENPAGNDGKAWWPFYLYCKQNPGAADCPTDEWRDFYFQKAVDGGNGWALETMSEKYDVGSKEEVYWMEKAAQAGNQYAIDQLKKPLCKIVFRSGITGQTKTHFGRYADKKEAESAYSGFGSKIIAMTRV